MPAHLSGYLIMLLLLALIVWRRVNRTFGRQPIRRKRMMARIGTFIFIGSVLALGGLHQLALAEGLVGGVLIGGGVGLVGLQLTRFETDPVRGDCYVPNPWIGGLLTVLLLGRLAWRLMVAWPQIQHASALAAAPGAGTPIPPMGYASSPLTMLVIGLLVGYYIVYYSGVLVHHRRFLRSQPAGAVGRAE